MKSRFLIIVATVVIAFTACTKTETVEIELQPHDENRMMDTMHAMMDKMMAMPKTNDPEVDFVKMMVMHHQGAISMANVELQAGKDDSLKRTAQKITTEQQAEIQQFNTLLVSLQVDNSDTTFAMEQMNNMTKMGKTADI